MVRRVVRRNVVRVRRVRRRVVVMDMRPCAGRPVRSPAKRDSGKGNRLRRLRGLRSPNRLRRPDARNPRNPGLNEPCHVTPLKLSGRDSNPQRTGYSPAVLPLNYPRKADRAGLEPAHAFILRRQLCQLSLPAVCGKPRGSRTQPRGLNRHPAAPRVRWKPQPLKSDSMSNPSVPSSGTWSRARVAGVSPNCPPTFIIRSAESLMI